MAEAKDCEEYKTNGKGCYIMNVDEQHAVDATRAYHRTDRLINNASRIANLRFHPPLQVNGQKHVVLLAKTAIPAGVECFYDYCIH